MKIGICTNMYFACISKPLLTCTKSTMEAPEQCVKSSQNLSPADSFKKYEIKTNAKMCMHFKIQSDYFKIQSDQPRIQQEMLLKN